MPPDLSGLRNGVLIDSVCSPTIQWTDDLAALRPKGVGAPLPLVGERPAAFAFLGSLAGVFAVVGIVGGGTLALSLLVSRRRDA